MDTHDDSKRLAALSATGLVNSPPIPAVDEMIGRLVKHYEVNAGWVLLFDDRRQFVLSAIGFEVTEAHHYLDYTHWATRALAGRQLPVIVSDCRKHKILLSHPDVVSGEMVFLAFAPLVTKDNYVIGCVGIDDIKSRPDFVLNEAEMLMEITRELKSYLAI